jgi:hypothetical protein
MYAIYIVKNVVAIAPSYYHHNECCRRSFKPQAPNLQQSFVAFAGFNLSVFSLILLEYVRYIYTRSKMCPLLRRPDRHHDECDDDQDVVIIDHIVGSPLGLWHKTTIVSYSLVITW